MRRPWRKKPKPDGLVAERRGAKLIRRNGRLYCECPFACMAACEPCEFSYKTTEEWNA